MALSESTLLPKEIYTWLYRHVLLVKVTSYYWSINTQFQVLFLCIFQSFEDDEFSGAYSALVGSFPKDFGYGPDDHNAEVGASASDTKPRILLMGLRRYGSCYLLTIACCTNAKKRNQVPRSQTNVPNFTNLCSHRIHVHFPCFTPLAKLPARGRNPPLSSILM